MKIGENLSTASYVPYQTTATCTLSDLDGTKTIYAVFRDAAGNETSSVSAQIQKTTLALGTPVMEMISDPEKDGLYRLYWSSQSATGATIYQVQESKKSDFGTVEREFWPSDVTELITQSLRGTYFYRVRAWDKIPGNGGTSGAWSTPKSIRVLFSATVTDEELLDQIEADCAKYFYFYSSSISGLVRDESMDVTKYSIASTGHGLVALTVLASRAGSTSNWDITTDQSRAQAEKILDTILNIQSRQTTSSTLYGTAGLLYHFLNEFGQRLSTYEVSTADSAILMAGVTTAGEYFGGTLKTKADQILSNCNWSYFLNSSTRQYHMGWFPESGLISSTYNRYTGEHLLISILARAKTGATPSTDQAFYAIPRQKHAYQGYEVVNSYFGSLFTYTLAHQFFDFQTRGEDCPSKAGFASVTPVNWWQNSINAVLANRQFCMDNAGSYASYGPDSWGISATIRPDRVYEGELGAAPCEANSGIPQHDGTIAPHAAGSAIALYKPLDGGTLANNLPFKALRHFYDNHRRYLWGEFGPYASLQGNAQGNITYAPFYHGIENGLIVEAIENYRSGLIWQSMNQNTRIQNALQFFFEKPASPGFGSVAVTHTPSGTLGPNMPAPITMFVGTKPANSSLVVNGQILALTPDTSWFYNPSNLEEGVNVLAFSATPDNGQTVSNTVTKEIVWDSLPPANTSISIDQAPITISRNITLYLQASEAVYYQVSENACFTGVSWTAFPTGTTQTSAAFTLSESYGNKTVYARFMDESNNKSAAVSAQINYSSETDPLPAPVLDPVTDADGNGIFTLTWSDMRPSGATIYELQQDTVIDFSNSGRRYFWPSGNFEPVTVTPPGTFYYRVRAWTKPPEKGGVSSPFSATQSITISAAQPPETPQISNLGGASYYGQYRVPWTSSASTGATKYEVQEATDVNFTSPATYWNDAAYHDTGYNAPNRYYYRVRAWTREPWAGGVSSDWSIAQSKEVTTKPQYKFAGTKNRITQITDTASRIIRLEYGTNGKVSRVIDPANQSIYYYYDSQNNLTSVKDRRNNEERYGYLSNHNMSTVTDKNGYTITNTYYYNDRVATQTDPMGKVTKFNYMWETTWVTNDNNVTAFYKVSQTGLLESIIDRLGNIESFTYDTDENIASKTDKRGMCLSD